jgi:large subunit ribosomal protein L13
MGSSCIERNWYLLDVSNKVLGRCASLISGYLRGKGKVCYVPNRDVGDYIIVINAKKVILTGNKCNNKVYYSHSGYPGGLKVTRYLDLLSNFPERVFQRAVKGMLPKNKLNKVFLRKLKVYPGAEHPHLAQSPLLLKV